jgi:hypothetical protein
VAAAPTLDACHSERSVMAQPIPSQQDVDSVTPLARRAGVIAAAGGVAVVGALSLAAVVLWFQYGTALFFEMIASGIAACF